MKCFNSLHSLVFPLCTQVYIPSLDGELEVALFKVTSQKILSKLSLPYDNLIMLHFFKENFSLFANSHAHFYPLLLELEHNITESEQCERNLEIVTYKCSFWYHKYAVSEIKVKYQNLAKMLIYALILSNNHRTTESFRLEKTFKNIRS